MPNKSTTPYTISELLEEALPGPWEVAKGGRSINTAGGGKIRCEAGRDTSTMAWATMILISTLHGSAQELEEALEVRRHLDTLTAAATAVLERLEAAGADITEDKALGRLAAAVRGEVVSDA